MLDREPHVAEEDFFRRQVESQFAFLVSDFDLKGPDRMTSHEYGPCASLVYTGSGVRVSFTFTPGVGPEVTFSRATPRGYGKAVGIDVFRLGHLLRVLGEPDVFRRRDSCPYTPDEVAQGLARCADLIRRSGPEILRGDFSRLFRYADAHIEDFPLRRLVADAAT